MIRILKIIPLLIIFVFLSGCFNTSTIKDGQKNNSNSTNQGDRGDLSSGAEINISHEVISQFDREKTEILKRYLAGSPLWEIRKESGNFYAVRRELVNGRYETTLNGFYSVSRDDGSYQTRVILSFESPYGFGRDYGNVTKVPLEDDDTIKPIIEEPHSGTAGYSSYVMFIGKFLNLEIYEQAPQKKRYFTEKIFREINEELNEVLTYLKEVKITGMLPIPERYPFEFRKKPSFKIKDGMQPGIYLLEAWINPTTEGEVYAKVFDKKTGLRLSQSLITPRSTRIIGWSENGKIFFPYNSQITVYEGDWSHEYEARFELWHRSFEGHEYKLVERTRKIHGWER